jgi:hypothetical protein
MPLLWVPHRQRAQYLHILRKGNSNDRDKIAKALDTGQLTLESEKLFKLFCKEKIVSIIYFRGLFQRSA